MINEEAVDYEFVKEIAQAINDANLLEEPVQIVGIKKTDLMESILSAVEAIDDSGFLQKLPIKVTDAYNLWISDEAEGGAAVAAEVSATPEATEAAPTEETPTEVASSEEAPTEEKGKKPKKEKKPKATRTKREKKEGEESTKIKPLRTKYANFEELKKFLFSESTLTSEFDKLTLEPHTWKNLFELFRAKVEAAGVEFKSLRKVTDMKSHIEYRMDRGWVYKREGEGEEETIQLVDFSRKQ